MNIEGQFSRHSVTSSETSSAWEIFFMPNLHMVFPFLMSNWGYIEQVKFFQKWRNFEVWANFFVKSVIGRKLSKPDSQEHSCILSFWSTFWLKNWRSYGNLKIWPIFFTWWPSSMTYFFVNVTNWNCWPTHSMCGPILVIICQSVRELCLTKRTD